MQAEWVILDNHDELCNVLWKHDELCFPIQAWWVMLFYVSMMSYVFLCKHDELCCLMQAWWVMIFYASMMSCLMQA